MVGAFLSSFSTKILSLNLIRVGQNSSRKNCVPSPCLACFQALVETVQVDASLVVVARRLLHALIDIDANLAFFGFFITWWRLTVNRPKWVLVPTRTTPN